MRCLWLCTLVLLVGCQSVSTKADHLEMGIDKAIKAPKHAHKPNAATRLNWTRPDKAPTGPLPSHFRKVLAKDEPLSRYGNPSAYTVKGVTYEVLRTSSGYKTRGLASWYATKFHAQRTSSGDDYDMYSLTAAHKTLPIPTYVRIKNLENGKEAIIKVNDRGPFHEDRLIDLSYGSAVKLGVFPRGTALVEIEALSTPGGKDHVAAYYVQAAALNSKKLADALKIKLARLSTSPVFIESYQGRYLVKVGPFATRDMTTQLKRTLEQNGVQGAFAILG